MQSNAASEGHLETPILQYDSGAIAAKLDRTEKELVHKVSFHISSGESLALIGETGSGKTLIAQSVMGVLPGNVKLVSGEIAFCGNTLPKGKNLRSMLGREIVYIPQNGHEFLDPSRSIRRQMFDSIAKLGIAAPQREAFAREKLARPDPVRLEVFYKLLLAERRVGRNGDEEAEPRRVGVGRCFRENQILLQVGEIFEQIVRVLRPALDERIELLELLDADRRLPVGNLEIVADVRVGVFVVVASGQVAAL